MLHLATVVAGIEVYGGAVDRPLRAETNQHAVLAAGHLLDQRPRLLGERLPRHDLTDSDHRIDHEIEVGIETCRPIQLQVREWPLFVEHTDRRLAQALDGLGLGARRHGGDQDIVTMSGVVHHRHRRWAFLALKREDAGAVLAHENAALFGVHHDRPGLLRCSSPVGVRASLGAGTWPQVLPGCGRIPFISRDTRTTLLGSARVGVRRQRGSGSRGQSTAAACCRALQVLGDSDVGRRVGDPVRVVSEFDLECGEESLRDGVVPAVGAPAHAAHDAVRREHRLIVAARVLAAAE